MVRKKEGLGHVIVVFHVEGIVEKVILFVGIT